VHVFTALDEAKIKELRERDEFFWIDLVHPSDDEVDQLGQVLGLHPVAMEDTREFGQRPKLDPYGDYVMLVFYSARPTGDPDRPAAPIEVHLYLSGQFMATVRRDRCDALDALHAKLHDQPTHDEEVLIYRVLDSLTDAYYPVIDALENEIDELEAAVLVRPRREHLTRSYRLKQNVHELHRLVAAQRDLSATAPDAILRLHGLESSSRPYLRDIGDHLFQIAGEFQRQSEDLFSLTQTYFNANSDRLNAVATRLTIGGTIFVIYTVVTGFFGQNFGWLVTNIDTKMDFLIFGVGALTIPTVILLTLFWIKRDDWF
jgi:magnesium transporter